jgi:hypothetical protein
MSTIASRTFKSTPDRDASRTWILIVDLLTQGREGNARNALLAVAGIAASVIADQATKDAAITVTCDGPRKLLAYVLAHGVRDLDKHMQPDANGRNSVLDLASAWLWLVLEYAKFSGSLKSDAECDSIIKGTLALFAVDKVDDGKNLLSLVAGKVNAQAALTRLVRDHFNVPTWQIEG